MAKQVQGALPLVGLLSRLASPSGGIGRDELVSCRPSYCYRTGLDSQDLLWCCFACCRSTCPACCQVARQ